MRFPTTYLGFDRSESSRADLFLGRWMTKPSCERYSSLPEAAIVVRRLKTARVGMLGHRTIGMAEVAFHEYDLREVFGPIVTYLSTDMLLRQRDEIPEAEAKSLWQKVRGRAAECKVAG